MLHAKLLIVDGRRALVGSANLTHRALTANLEAGVLIEDPDLAAGLEEHVLDRMADGTLDENQAKRIVNVVLLGPAIARCVPSGTSCKRSRA